MSKNKIEKLGNYKQQILLLEIGSLIHDVGKLNDYFIERHSLEKSNDYDHGDVLEYDSCQEPKYNPSSSQIKKKAEKVKELVENTKICIDKDLEASLYLLMTEHHNTKSDNKIVKILIASDKFDAEEDRGGARDRQSIYATYKSNAFGYEEPLDLDYEDERRKVYEQIVDLLNTCDIEEVKGKRQKFLNSVKKSFEKTLGETQRAANDVSLWEHSYMTASICKALFNWEILQSDFPNGFPHFKEKQDIKNKKPFKILSIGWDYDEFLAQAEKIPDIIGRTEILKEIKDGIKNKIEVEFLLGNCIYEDDYGLHFLIPAVFEENDLIQVVEEIQKIFNENTNGILVPFVNLSEKGGGELTKLLPEAIGKLKDRITGKNFSYGEKIFKPAWIFDWDGNLPKNKLICPLCGKGFYCEGDEEKICKTCKDIRRKGRVEKPLQTRFIDEIAWDGEDYRYVGLFTLNFDLRNWLNGKYVRSLLLRKDYRELKHNVWKLWSFYRSNFYDNNKRNLNEEFLKNLFKFKKLNALPKAKKGLQNEAQKEIKKWFEEYDKCNSFEQEILSEFKQQIQGINEILEKGGEITEEQINNLRMTNIRNRFREILEDLEKYFKNDAQQSIFEAKTKKEAENVFFKTSSPSRLMRVWNSTEAFFKEIEKRLCEKSRLIDRYKIVGLEEDELKELLPDTSSIDEILGPGLTIKIEEKRGGCFIEKRDGEYSVVVITPHLNELLKDKERINFSLKYNEKEKEFSNKKVKETPKIRGFRIISVSPTRFIFLYPADKTLELLKAIRKTYMDVFGKVYGKLPLNIGIVFGKRKTPMFSLIDASKRFVERFSAIHEISKNKQENLPALTVKNVNGKQIKTEEGYILKVPTTLGNGEVDPYHPFIRIRDDDKDAVLTGDGIKQKHISMLSEGDEILVDPSLFDYLVLDANIRRFDISYDSEGKREHPIIGKNGLRPYLLEDIERFQRLKEIFEKIGAWSPIRDVEALAASKRQEWSIDEELLDKDVYEEFISSTLENKSSRFFNKDKENWKQNIKPFLLECILDGSFFDAIELFESIMKIDLKGGEDV